MSRSQTRGWLLVSSSWDLSVPSLGSAKQYTEKFLIILWCQNPVAFPLCVAAVCVEDVLALVPSEVFRRDHHFIISTSKMKGIKFFKI